jgi:hypothetical protein
MLRFRSKLRKILNLTAVLVIFCGNLFASSHSEAPGIGRMPKMDCTDVYAFVSPDRPDTVTLIANYIPLAEPAAGPNFYRFDDDGIYEINIINDGDTQDDIIYRFQFNTAIAAPDNFISFLPGSTGLQQTYTLTEVRNGRATVLGSNLPVPTPNVGPKTTPNYSSVVSSSVATVADIRAYAGPADDPFYIDLGAIFDALTIRKVPGNAGGGVDTLAGFNIYAIAVQVPISRLTSDGGVPANPNSPNAIIGVYSTSYLPKNAVQGPRGPQYSGPRVQVSRLGMPLVNELVIPLKDKDKWNSSKLKNDTQFLNYVTTPSLPGAINAIYGISVPPAPRNDLVAVFLTGVSGLNQPANVTPGEMIRLNMAIPPTQNPNRLGVIGGDLAGYPNGRRLADDTVDISLRVVAGVLVDGFNVAPNNQLGDGVDQNDVAFTSSFPYLGIPQSPLNARHNKRQQ